MKIKESQYPGPSATAWNEKESFNKKLKNAPKTAI